MTESILRHNFSRSAQTYDDHSVIQQIAGQHLLDCMQGQPKTILELGCGTGVFTHALSERFSAAEITAVDFSEAMISEAQEKDYSSRVRFVNQSIDAYENEERFDLITANACLHWLTDPVHTLSHLQQLLKQNGGGYFSVFGPRTYTELDTILKEAGGARPASHQFPQQERWKQWLESLWQVVTVTVVEQTRHYDSLLSLLQKIKYSGTQGSIGHGHSFTRRQLEMLDAAYRERYGDIAATYEIFLLQVHTSRRTT